MEKIINQFLDECGITKGPWHIMRDGFGKIPGSHPTIYATNNDLNYVATCADYGTIDPVNNLANANIMAVSREMLATHIQNCFRIEKWKTSSSAKNQLIDLIFYESVKLVLSALPNYNMWSQIYDRLEEIRIGVEV